MSSIYTWPWSSLGLTSEPSAPLNPADVSLPLPLSEAEAANSEKAGEPASLMESNQASYSNWLCETYQQWCVDSGRPEKGQKYILSLNRSIDTFKKSGYNLHQLSERLQAESSSSKPGWDGYYFSGALDYYFPCSSQSFHQLAYLALKALNSPDQYTNVRLQYADFLQNLRSALDSKDYLEQSPSLDQNLVKLIETLCYDKFINTHLFNYWEAFLVQLCGEIPEQLDFSSFSDLLNSHNEKLHHTPPELRKECLVLNYEKLQGTLGASFDPVGRSNVPKKRSEQTVENQEGSWSITRLAHGTPTLEENILTKACRYTYGSYNAKIIPEYKAFLREAKQRGERVFYVNLQKIKGLEEDRSSVIEQLQSDPEFQETFYSMALPMDGSEFSNLIKKQVSTEEFKSNLLKLFFDEKNQLTLTSAKLPRDLLVRMSNHPDLAFKVADHMRYLINQVHNLYFDSAELISEEDRQDFIMQFYSDLTDYMISMEYKRQDTGLPLNKHERIAHVIQACKDCKDRGGAKTGIDEAKYILLTYPLNEPEKLHQALHDLYINTLGAYTIKFEEILTNRLVYFTSLMKRYGKLAQDPEKIQRIRDSQPEYFQVRKHISARAFDNAPTASVPTIQTALTQQDYLTALKNHPEISIEFNPASFEPQQLSKQILDLVQSRFTPTYADFNFSLPSPINPNFQTLLESLKTLCDKEGQERAKQAIDEILTIKEDDEWVILEKEEDLDEWTNLDKKESSDEQPFASPIELAKQIGATAKGAKDFLNMINWAIDQGDLKLDKASVLPNDYTPEGVNSLFSWAQIEENQAEQTLLVFQDLHLINNQKKEHQLVQAIVEKRGANATIRLQML